MSTWTNGQLPSHNQWSTDMYISQVTAERDIWKKRAENLRTEMVNISESIEKYGYWQCPVEGGGYIVLVKKPAIDEPAPAVKPKHESS